MLIRYAGHLKTLFPPNDIPRVNKAHSMYFVGKGLMKSPENQHLVTIGNGTFMGGALIWINHSPRLNLELLTCINSTKSLAYFARASIHKHIQTIEQHKQNPLQVHRNLFSINTGYLCCNWQCNSRLYYRTKYKISPCLNTEDTYWFGSVKNQYPWMYCRSCSLRDNFEKVIQQRCGRTGNQYGLR